MIRRTLAQIGMSALLLAVGVGGLFGLMATRKQAPRKLVNGGVPEVATLAVDHSIFSEPIVGHGTVQAKRRIQIIPEVSGRLVWVKENLAPGVHVEAGTKLFQIDDRRYQAQKRQALADIDRLKNMIERLGEDEENLKVRLANARELEAETKASLNWELDNKAEGNATRPEVDILRERYLRQKGVSLGLESLLDAIPYQIAEATAQMEATRANLDQAELNIENTVIRTEFSARVDQLTAQESQFVLGNLAIATLSDLSILEIPVVVDPRELPWAEQNLYDITMGGDTAGETSPAETALSEVAITTQLYGRTLTWTGRVSRLQKLDPMTRTAHVVVEFDGVTVTDNAELPGLTTGIFCTASLPAQPLNEALVVPRHAIHEGNILYVFVPAPTVDDPHAGRLEFRQVPILRSVRDDVLVHYNPDSWKSDPNRTAHIVSNQALAECELKVGEFVIVSPLLKAVEGMKLRHRDVAATQVARYGESLGEFPIFQNLSPLEDQCDPLRMLRSRPPVIASFITIERGQ